MHTKTSHEKAVSALLEILKREEDILEGDRIRKESLTRFIILTARATYFTFDCNVFEQIVRLPLGSPLSPQIGKEMSEVTAATKSVYSVPG
ncbi:unnamed protein product [Protopolystoma xenopodis]|uniref:Uncharacterized protein n=1 Tax=Protopolystoma xenopodis TaxID=117903 RepID=A0A3S5AZL9_9PLAT|nr:unnamed protein product [Protopolystoma xenopodis]